MSVRDSIWKVYGLDTLPFPHLLFRGRLDMIKLNSPTERISLCVLCKRYDENIVGKDFAPFDDMEDMLGIILAVQ